MLFRPFNFGKVIPTDEDVAGIATSIQPEDEVPGYRDGKYDEKIRILLDLVTSPTSAEEPQSTFISYIPRACDEFGTSPVPKRKEEGDNIGYLLTHRERIRASTAKCLRDAAAQQEFDEDAEHRIVPRPHSNGHEVIPGEDETLPNHEGQGDRDSFNLPEYHCAQSHGHPFDDSGISFVDSIVAQFSANEYLAPHLLPPPQDDSLEGNKDNIDNQCEDKENVPPWDVRDYQPASNQPDSPANQYDWTCYFEFPESQPSPFKPLSFASQSQLLGSLDNLAKLKVPPPSPSSRHTKRPQDELRSTGEHEGASSRLTKRCKLDDLVPASAKDLFSTFIALRKQVPSSTVQLSETRNDTPAPYQTPYVSEPTAPRVVPDDLFDQHTVRLPEDWVPAAAIHRYLVSMDVIQKRALVRELQGHHCQVVLVERSDLGGTDIIVDPDFGILFIQLLALPANINSAVERISEESWRYSNLLVIFEAFPSAKSYRADRSQDSRSVLYAYTPPICKAIKKLRRNIGIAEGCGTMNSECRVTWAFANDVQEAARLVRCFGEEVCALSAERDYGLQWDNRAWLEEEEHEVRVLIMFEGLSYTCH